MEGEIISNATLFINTLVTMGRELTTHMPDSKTF